jgi:hypothetical protein
MRSGQGFFLLEGLSRIGGPPPAAAAPVYWLLAAGLLAMLALACIFDKGRDVTASAAKAQLLLLIFLLVLSPNYPWYFLVLVPLGCIAPWWPARILTLLSFVLYVAPPIDGDPRTFVAQGILYGTVIVVLAFDLYNRLPHRRGERRAASRRHDEPAA